MKIGSLFWDIGAKTDGFDQGLDKSKTKAKEFGKQAQMTFTEINSAVMLAGKALEVMKKGFEFVEAGAQLEFTQDKFDRLAVSIGTTGDALEGKLRPELRGMLSDAEGIQLASDLMSLGLAKTEDQAIRLTSVASQLGMDMNQLTLTLSNQTTMRFDSIGVSIDGFDERLKRLKDSGMDTNDAFTEAFLQQAEKQIETVGSAADSAIAPFRQIRSELKNMTDAAKIAASEGFAPLAASFADYLNLTVQAQNASRIVTRAVDLGLITKQEANIAALATNYEEWADFAGLLLPKIQALETASESYTSAMEGERGEWKERQNSGGAYINLLEDTADAEKELTEQMIKDLEERNEAITSYNEKRIDEVGRFSDIEQRYAEDSASIAEELGDVQAELALRRSQGYSEWSGTIQGLLDKEGELITRQEEVEAAHDKATKSIILGYLEQKMAADGILTDDETEWLLAKGVEWGIYADNAVQAYKDAQAAADEAMGHFVDKSVTLTVNVRTNTGLGANQLPGGYSDYLPQIGMASGGSFMVPPGYNNDSFIMGVQSGETVTVETPQQRNQPQQQPQASFDYRRMGEAVAEALLQTGAI